MKFNLTRKEASQLLGLATINDHLAGRSAIAITDEYRVTLVERGAYLSSAINPEILKAAPVVEGWEATNEWIGTQRVEWYTLTVHAEPVGLQGVQINGTRTNIADALNRTAELPWFMHMKGKKVGEPTTENLINFAAEIWGVDIHAIDFMAYTES